MAEWSDESERAFDRRASGVTDIVSIETKNRATNYYYYYYDYYYCCYYDYYHQKAIIQPSYSNQIAII